MIKLFGKNYPVRKLLLFITEGLFLLTSLALVDVLKNGGDISVLQEPALWPRLFVIVTVCLLCLYYNDLYTFKGKINYLEMSTRLFQAIGVACILLGFLFFLFPSLLPARQIFITSLVVFILSSSIWRYGYCFILKHRCCAIPVMVLGLGQFLDEVVEEIHGNIDCGYRVAAVAVKEPDQAKNFGGVSVFSSYSYLLKKVQDAGSRAVIVAMDERRGNLPVNELLECKMHGIPIIEGETFFEELTGKLLVDKINPSWLIFKEGFIISSSSSILKRLVGAVISLVGLVIASPVLLVTAILIKIDSPGPILFSQERVGKDGQTFNILKFRSMRTDAEKDGAKWAKENDDRVTRVGKIIRKLRIDEIPQMWNVLRGDMNFVGPRPERPVFVEELSRKIRYYNQRHTVRPGITGWAQINYPYGASEEDAKKKLEYDLYYIKHMTVLLDVYIMLKTVKTIIFKMGSR